MEILTSLPQAFGDLTRFACRRGFVWEESGVLYTGTGPGDPRHEGGVTNLVHAADACGQTYVSSTVSEPPPPPPGSDRLRVDVFLHT